MYSLMTIFSSPTSLLGFYDRIKHTQYWECALILSLETKLEQDIVGLDFPHCWTPCWTISRSPAQQPETDQPAFLLSSSFLASSLLSPSPSFLPLSLSLSPSIPLSLVPLSFMLFLPLSPTFLLVFETGSHHVSQTGLEPTLRTQPPACWDGRCVLLLLLSFTFYTRTAKCREA